MKPTRESRLRSVLKGITWRILATSATILLAFLITGKVHVAIQIGFLEFITKLLLYYFHERAWLLLPVGSVRKIYKYFQRV